MHISDQNIRNTGTSKTFFLTWGVHCSFLPVMDRIGSSVYHRGLRDGPVQEQMAPVLYMSVITRHANLLLSQ